MSQSHLGDLGRELADLDAVELVHVHLDERLHREQLLARVARGAQHLQLQQAQLAVGDDQEVAAAAGRVEEGEQAQSLVEVEQPVAVVFDPFELAAQVVEKKRADGFWMFASLV